MTAVTEGAVTCFGKQRLVNGMCELFGFTAPDDRDITEYLRLFYGHSVRHPNGWGLADMHRGFSQIEKEPVQATKSDYLKYRLRAGVTGHDIFAHIRYATVGNIDYQNCHPFTGRDSSGRVWTLMHNGTIFDFEPANRYTKVQRGESDSERILLYLLDQMNEAIREKGSRLNREERFDIIDQMVCEMSPHNKLNLMIFDGATMYVHSNTEDTLFELHRGGATMFSTLPLDGDAWIKVPQTQLMGYRSGKLTFTGTVHGCSYIPNPKEAEWLYLGFAAL